MKRQLFALTITFTFLSYASAGTLDQITCQAQLISQTGEQAQAIFSGDTVRHPRETKDPTVNVTEGNLRARIRLEKEDLTGFFRLNYFHATEKVASAPRSAQVLCMTGAIMVGDEEFNLFGCPEWIVDDVFGPDTYWSSTTNAKGYEEFDPTAMSEMETEIASTGKLRVTCQYLGSKNFRRVHYRQL